MSAADRAGTLQLLEDVLRRIATIRTTDGLPSYAALTSVPLKPTGPLARLRDNARLDDRDLEILIVAASPDLNPAATHVLGLRSAAERIRIGELVAMLPFGHRFVEDRLSRWGRLRRFGLIEVEPDDESIPWPQRQVRCPERVLEGLCGHEGLARRLHHCSRRLETASDESSPPSEALAKAVFDRFELVCVPGPISKVASLIAATAASRKHSALLVDLSALLVDGGADLLHAWARETVLSSALSILNATQIGANASWTELDDVLGASARPTAFVGIEVSRLRDALSTPVRELQL